METPVSRRRIKLAAFASVLTLTGSLAAACGSSGSSGSSDAAFNAATCQGGTLQVLDQSTEDTGLDPAVLYTSGGGATSSAPVAMAAS